MSYQTPQKRRLETSKIVAIYALFGLAWIYGSDTVLGWLVHNPVVMVKIAVIKGSLFILCTATLLYFLINRFVRQLTSSETRRIESMRNYEAIFNATNEAIFIHDAHDGRILDVNDRMLELYDYKRDEALSVDIEDLSEGTSPYSQTEAVKSVRKAMSEGPQVFEWHSRKKSGELFWSEISLRRITTNDLDRIIAVVRDISERKQLDDALKTREERHRIILDSAMDGYMVMSQQGKLLEVNEAYCRMSGYSKQELLTKSIADLEVNESATDAVAHNKKIAEQGEDRFVAQHRRKDGTVFDVEVSAKFLPVDGGLYVGFLRDITERKRYESEKRTLEQQFQQAQKLESLGVLAGGIAHDFNNILAIIIGHCSLATMRPDTADEHIPIIEKAADRAAGLCHQMLAYAGKAAFSLTQVNLAALVGEMVQMLKATTNQNVTIKLDLSSDIPAIKGDVSQLRQIVMNLIINASEAIGEAQGAIRVSLAQATITAEQPVRDHLGRIIPPGWYACLEVSDTGCGMDDETKQRIFEPFYTTKFTGRGLGMSAILGIISAHKGSLQLTSQPGHGSTFTIYLPIGISDSTGEKVYEHNAGTSWQGSGTVLLVEDEDQVRLVAKTMLEALGFNVIVASNGKEALESYRKNSPDIALVVTDIGMPVMDGYMLFRELKKLRPDLPIIISSGFGDSVVTTRIPSEEIAGSISKPYRFDQLQVVLKSVLECG